MLLFLALAMLSAPLEGAEDRKKEGKSATKTSSSDKAAEAKKSSKRAEPRGRLPRYYRAVVDESQRESIYSIQRGYKDRVKQLETKIGELRKQMKALKQSQDEEVQAVLSPKQLAEVNRLREAAKKARAESRKTAAKD